MPVHVENTIYFGGTTIEKRPAIPSSIYDVLEEEFKGAIRRIQKNVVRSAELWKLISK